MGFIPFLIFMAIFFGKTKGDNRKSDIFKIIIGINVVLALMSSFLNSGISVIAVIGLFLYVFYQIKKTKQRNSKSDQYGWDPQRWDREQGNRNTYDEYREHGKAAGRQRTKSTLLPQSIAKRRKIIQNFNEKYNLCLTEKQVQGIADSTYMSEIWKKEVEDMNQKYETVSQWFMGYTKWLRVYMYVFHVQEITSDIRQQESICMYAFEEIFRYVDLFSDASISEKINHVNEKFFTSFDDVSFMIAYRFLESKGLHHNLGSSDIVRDDAEMDELLKKYQTQDQRAQ